MDKGTWQAIIPNGDKESDTTEATSAHTHVPFSGTKCTHIVVQLSPSSPSWDYCMFSFSSFHLLGV